MSNPWIGAHYDRWRVLACGINLYQYGGTSALKKVVGNAKKYLRDGRSRVSPEEGRGGSLIFHRAAAYSALVLREMRHPSLLDIGPEDVSPARVAEALDSVAFVNYVKCSPAHLVSAFSQPTAEMVENCGRLVFNEELSLLSPKVVLMLGDPIFRAFASLSGATVLRRSGGVIIYDFPAEGKKTLLIGLPHPSRAGSRRSLFEELERGLRLDGIQRRLRAGA